MFQSGSVGGRTKGYIHKIYWHPHKGPMIVWRHYYIYNTYNKSREMKRRRKQIGFNV